MEKTVTQSAGARSDELLPEQTRVLKEYNRDNTLNGLAPLTCKNKLKDITLFAKKVQKPFDQVIKEDIKTYINDLSQRIKPNTLSIKKSCIKSFFKWFYETEDYPDLVRWIKTGYAKSKHRLPESILTPEEVNTLIEVATKIKDKALIAVLFDIL
jgi:site-specific recombinase XerD